MSRTMKKISSGKYYSAFARPRKDSGKSQLLIIRRDTHELEVSTTVDTQSIEAKASASITGLGEPLDWQAPYRTCLSYFLKIRRKKEEFSQRLLSDKLSKRQIFAELKKFEAYRYHLLKKLHRLSDSEKTLLLTPSKKECVAKSTEDIDLLQARDELFGLFFDVTKEMSLAHKTTASAIIKIKSTQAFN